MSKSCTITKEKIAQHLKNQLGFSSLLCEDIATVFFESIFELTNNEKKLVLTNFGTWLINHKKTRPGLNIKTGQAVEIAPRSVLRFIPAKSFKEQIN